MALKLDFVDALRANEQVLIDTMQDAVARYGDLIQGELALIHANYSPRWIAQSAALFAIMSPKADFDFNVSVTQPLRRVVSYKGSETELAATIRHHGLGLHNVKARRIKAMEAFIEVATLELMQPQVLRAFLGFGPKVTSMGCALANPWAKVYTLDRHMYRILCLIAGVPPQETATNATYRELERYLVDLHARVFPTLPTFVSQWALWDLAFGEHKSHVAIFEG